MEDTLQYEWAKCRSWGILRGERMKENGVVEWDYTVLCKQGEMDRGIRERIHLKVMNGRNVSTDIKKFQE